MNHLIPKSMRYGQVIIDKINSKNNLENNNSYNIFQHYMKLI